MSWLEREELLFGPEFVARLKESTVAIIGVGGVGGAAAEMVARAGVGKLILLDADTVSDSNRNRQIIALTSTLGQPKCAVLSQRLKDINPEIEIVCIKQYLEADKVEETLAPYAAEIDFLIDAIDTLSPKLSLIRYCVENKIPLVSSMGAGAKFDVTKIRIADLSRSFNCPLAFIVRKRLKKMGISKGFPVVFSEELPERSSIVEAEERNKKSQVGSISYIPFVFGCACAQAALLYLKNQDKSL